MTIQVPANAKFKKPKKWNLKKAHATVSQLIKDNKEWVKEMAAK